MTPFDRWQVEAGLSVLTDEELVAGWWQCPCGRVNHDDEKCTCESITAGVVTHFHAESDEDDNEVVLVLGREPRATL